MMHEEHKINAIKVHVGQLVRTWRKRENLSQEDLALKLDLSRLTIQNLEAGKNTTLETLLSIFGYFNALDQFDEFVLSLTRSE
ncbi:MAG TPA: helix-turn-helix transcriptional regulator [Bacteroidia bacterium]